MDVQGVKASAANAKLDSSAAINGISAEGSNTGRFDARPQTFGRDHAMFEHTNNILISGGHFSHSTQQGSDGINLCSSNIFNLELI